MHIRNFPGIRECGLLAAAAVLLIARPPTTVSGNTCIAGKPVKVSGRFCGRVFDPTGTAVPDAKLRLTDETEKRTVVAETRADARGDFVFPQVPRGRYLLTSPDWVTGGDVQVTGRGGTICRHPFYVQLALYACGGGISKKRARHFREPKSERQK